MAGSLRHEASITIRPRLRSDCDVQKSCLQVSMPSGTLRPALPADDIRERVKALGFERHKVVVYVCLGELKGQTFSSCSLCLWDTATDGFASETFRNESLFATAQVFALYFE